MLFCEDACAAHAPGSVRGCSRTQASTCKYTKVRGDEGRIRRIVQAMVATFFDSTHLSAKSAAFARSVVASESESAPSSSSSFSSTSEWLRFCVSLVCSLKIAITVSGLAIEFRKN
jgi:hypothetical protein